MPVVRGTTEVDVQIPKSEIGYLELRNWMSKPSRVKQVVAQDWVSNYLISYYPELLALLRHWDRNPLE